MTEQGVTRVAEQLHQWFDSVTKLTEEAFGMQSDGPHRDAIVLDILRRNARIVTVSPLDSEGKLYSPLCFFLVAACRKLGIPLGAGHWRAAVSQVIHLSHTLATIRVETANVGLEFDTPPVFFKRELEETINRAGLVSGVTYLNKQNQQVALGLAINWAMRLLLAYALEASAAPPSPGRKDLTWLGELMRGIVEAPATV